MSTEAETRRSSASFSGMTGGGEETSESSVQCIQGVFSLSEHLYCLIVTDDITRERLYRRSHHAHVF